MPSSVALRRTLFGSLLLLLIVAPLAPQVAAVVAEGPRPPSVTVVHDADTLPSTAAAILREVTWEGGYEGIRFQRAGGAEAFRDAVRRSDAHVVVLIAHGDADGLHVGGATIPWAEVAEDLRASGARDAILLACGSAAVGELAGVRLLKVYEDRVDLEVAALDAAHVLGSAHLTNARLLRYSEAHTAYMMRTGGPMRYLSLMLSPERPLDMTACQQTWGNWRSQAYSSNPYYYSCQSPLYLRPNPSCTWTSQYHCQGFTSEHQKNLEHDIETKTSAKVTWGGQLELMDGLLEIKMGTEVGSKEYEFYVTFGGDTSKSGTSVFRGHRVTTTGTCVEIFELTDFVAPALDQVTQALNSLPNVAAQFDGVTFMVCASIEGGILYTPDEPVTKGHLTGRVDFRISAGAKIAMTVWFCPCLVEGSLTVSYPLEGTFDLENRKAQRVLHVMPSFNYGPFEIEIKENVFHSYWALEIPLLAGKKDGKAFDIDYSRFVPGASPDAGVQTAARFEPLSEEAIAGILARLPAGVEVVASPAEVVHPVQNGQGTPLYDLIEVAPGDAFFNHLAKSGAFARLGVDPEAVGRDQVVVLDLADPDVYEAIYLEPTTRQRTLLGIPGGTTLAALPCQTVSTGQIVAIHLGGCDPTRSLLGVEGWYEGDEAVLGLRPTATAKGLVAGASQGGQELVHETVCVGAAFVTLPSGRTYTRDEVCRWLAYGSSFAEPEGTIAVANAAHAQKLALVMQGMASWLSNACTLDLTTVLQGQDQASVCLSFSWPSTPEPGGALTGALTPSQIINDFVVGKDRIDRFTHDTASGQDLIAMDRTAWVTNEPVTHAVGGETAILNDPLTPVSALAKRIECTATRPIFGEQADCQNVEPLL